MQKIKFKEMEMTDSQSYGSNMINLPVYVLIVNGGSSTFKFSLYSLKNKLLERNQDPIWRKTIEFKKGSDDRKQAILNTLKEINTPVNIICHRVVHGGECFIEPALITEDVKKTIKTLSPLAPLHNPINLEGIEVAEKAYPQAKQIAIFDTAFYSTLDKIASTYPIPEIWRREGIKRFGFHGISHQYCYETLSIMFPEAAFKKIVICHLGNGSSCTAIDQGVAIDTSMGFTPMEGLMMGTRSGSIDPGIMLYLMREKNYTYTEIDQALNKESGLFGICQDFDMRKIIERMNNQDKNATLAFNLYIHRLKKVIAELVASLGGLDILCFTAGIGENSAPVRQKTCEGLKFLGVEIDQHINCKNDCKISLSSKVNVFVIHTQEEWQMAKESIKFI